MQPVVLTPWAVCRNRLDEIHVRRCGCELGSPVSIGRDRPMSARSGNVGSGDPVPGRPEPDALSGVRRLTLTGVVLERP